MCLCSCLACPTMNKDFSSALSLKFLCQAWVAARCYELIQTQTPLFRNINMGQEILQKAIVPVTYEPQLNECSRQCSRPVLDQCSMGFGPNPLINGLILNTFKLNILFLEKFTVIHFY